MEIERVFMSCFSIEKKPDDIFTLIEAALQVGASKHPAQFQKRKNRMIKFLMDPSDDCILDDEEEGRVGDEMTNVEEKEKHNYEKLWIKKIEVESNKTNNKCNAMTEVKKTDLVQQFCLPHSHNNTNTMPARKRMANMSTKRVKVATPREKQLSSFKKKLEGDKKIQKKSVNTEKKREEGSKQTPTQRRSVNAKSMPPPLPLMKMNVATKPVEVAHQKQLSDCSPKKQSNCSSITKPMQKDTQSISDMKKFESSKRKFEERLAEERQAKRRLVMVDFHQMPKPANDPSAPKRGWNRKRF